MKQITAIVKPFKLEEVREALAECGRPDEQLARIAAHARERTLAEHTADRRAATLEQILSAGGMRETPIDACNLGHRAGRGSGDANTAAGIL